MVPVAPVVQAPALVGLVVQTAETAASALVRLHMEPEAESEMATTQRVSALG